MRLLNTETCQFVYKNPEETVYAILSHTWDPEKGEQNYEELKKIQQRCPSEPEASPSCPHVPNSSTSSTPLSPPSTPSKSWFTRRMARLWMLHQHSSTHRAPRIQIDTHASVRMPINAPFTNDPAVPQNALSPDSFTSPSAPTPELRSTKSPQSIWDDPELSPKIRDACRVARENGYRYIWIDSCCIDKSSSSELSEAINSMYQWYGLADVCYAYLADVPPRLREDHQAEGSCFRESRWFTRGWTLQELIAPINVVFLSGDWTPIGSKHTLDSLIESVTKINHRALLHLEPLDKFSVAQRLSWAADRVTTREEDRAYSLLGIFDINMPTLYGEGDRAFRRLQEHIMQRIPDQSLFAWGFGDIYRSSSWELPLNPGITDPPSILRISLEGRDSPRSPLASSSVPFLNSGSISTIRHAIQFLASHHQTIEYTPTPYGIRAEFLMIPLTGDVLSRTLRVQTESQLELPQNDPDSRWYLTILGCEHEEYPGHLLGRICYIPPSESGIEFLYCGYISFHDTEYTAPSPDLFPVLPETIQYYHRLAELKTVYIPHPDPANLISTFRHHPYIAIKLILLRETRDALCSRGYSAELRGPDAAHPTTHWLTLSKDRHSITVKFRHTLEDGGRRFTMDAEVKTSRSLIQLDRAIPDSNEADHDIVSWDDSCKRVGWRPNLWYSELKFGAAKAGMPGIDELKLEFAGTGVYVVRVDVLGGAALPPSSDV
ncbi:hypothetical protein V8D89_000266 [Ganoderma adspersum]